MAARSGSPSFSLSESQKRIEGPPCETGCDSGPRLTGNFESWWYSRSQTNRAQLVSNRRTP